jgi:hypothetical protein|tara:strand:- start:1037 stop:1411 length:375 start_codon:yes stop_codon:yes gene_type:complete
MITTVIITEQDPTGDIKVGIKFSNANPSKEEIEFVAELNMIIEAYSKSSGKILDGGKIEKEDTSIVAENPILLAQLMIDFMKHSGKNWEELEPYIIEQIQGCKFRSVTRSEMEKYDKYLKKDKE